MRDAIAAGHPIPKGIAGAPALQRGNELYYLAYTELMADRKEGFGEGEVPWSSVDRWARRHELTDEEADDLHYVVGRLDRAYLDYKASKRPKGKDGGG